jgi:sigma-B regulation protein RsbU (phosphoserine phosphatase)
MLPDLDGMAIVSKAREIRPEIIIVMITGHGSEEKAVEAIRAGADDYIPKPIDGNELLMKLSKAIEMRRLKDENLLFHRRLEKEIEIARKIQLSLLPQQTPDIAGIDIATFNQPAKYVGGDYHDLIALPSGEIGVAIGDVSGKGMPAALLMANVQASIRRCSEDRYSPKEIIQRVNTALCPVCQLIEEHRFMTLFYANLNHQSGELIFSNAGHNYPLIFKQDGSIHNLSYSGGIPCGIFDDFHYDEAKTKLEPHDVFVLYTDGIIESMNAEELIFSEERLVDLVSRNLGLSSNEIVDCICKELNEFMGESLQYDDMTLMVLKLLDD